MRVCAEATLRLECASTSPPLDPGRSSRLVVPSHVLVSGRQAGPALTLLPAPPLADRFGTDPQAIERICRAPRYALRNAGKAAAPALGQLVQSLPRRFEVGGCGMRVWMRAGGGNFSKPAPLAYCALHLLTAHGCASGVCLTGLHLYLSRKRSTYAYAMRVLAGTWTPSVACSSPQLAPLQASRHSAFLWVASELIKVFGDEPARDAELGACLSSGAQWGGPGWRRAVWSSPG